MRAPDPLTTMFSHHLWANLRLLERCAALSDEQLDSAILGAYGSIRDTMQHIVTAEQSYLSRISTGLPRRRAKDAPPMTMAEMIESARTTGAGLIEWAPRVAPGDMVTVDGDDGPLEVPKAIILTQVINHGTEHRAQIMATMTQLGVEPPDLQAWAYFDELAG